MRVAMLTALGLFCVTFLSTHVVAADETPVVKSWTGVIIDDHCADKMAKKDNPQQAAAAHDKACAIKCCSDDGVLGLMVDGKFHKFDANGTKLAKEYLAKADSSTTATVSGTMDASGNIAVTAINPAGAAAK